MDRNLALELIRSTEVAAIASGRLMGRGDNDAADQAAVDAMRRAFQTIPFNGTVVIGEGERDEAPMLYIGEEVGGGDDSSMKVDLALDPLEGTTICATGGPGALSVLAAAEKGKFLHAPDTYMDKIAVGPEAYGSIDLNKTPTENLTNISEALKKPIQDLTVVILDRDRHKGLIEEVRATGARIQLIEDGDVSAGIAAAWPNSGIDVLIGTGGAPEGVITAAALKCLGGDFQGRLNFRNEEEKARASKMGVTNLTQVFTRDELAQGEVYFAATGVTDGSLLKGVRFLPGNKATTESVVMRSKTGTVRFIQAHHCLDKKPESMKC